MTILLEDMDKQRIPLLPNCAIQAAHAACGTAYRCFKLPVLSVAPNFLLSGFVHQSTFRIRILTGAGAGGQFCHLPFSNWVSMLLKAWSRPKRPISFYFVSVRSCQRRVTRAACSEQSLPWFFLLPLETISAAPLACRHTGGDLRRSGSRRRGA